MRRLEWSPEAKANLDQIVTYLEEAWTEKEIIHFSERLEKQLTLLTHSPDIYKKSFRKAGLRECIITKHNTLFYTYDDERVYIVTLFDNRQNPEKLDRK